jgi:hypothetical protein
MMTIDLHLSLIHQQETFRNNKREADRQVLDLPPSYTIYGGCGGLTRRFRSASLLYKFIKHLTD